MRRAFHLALLFTFVGWAFIFFWLGGRSDPFWRGYALTGRQSDYYSLLVEGFKSGHLSMNAKVDPDLLSPDAAVRQRAPSLLDAALYHGHYYLYYGVTPAALVLYPYLILTGNEMGLEVACLGFALAALAAGTVGLARVQAWTKAPWGTGFAIVGVSVLAVVPGLPFLVRRSSFYDLAIIAGSAFAIGFWTCLLAAWTGPRPRRWLAAASLCLGCAVGGRPTLLLIAPALVVFAVLLARRGRRDLGSHLVSALAPAAVLGTLLAWYNAARFGNPLDFGVAHDVNVFFTSGNPLMAWRFLPANLRWYFFTPPSFAAWFPFDFPIQNLGMPAGFTDAEDINGLMPITLLALWSLAGLVLLRRRPAPAPPGRVGVAPWLAAAALGLFTCLLGVRAYRYSTDFMTPAALGLILVIGGAWARTGGLARWIRAGVCLLTAVAVVHALLGSVELFGSFKAGRPREFAAWSKALNPTQRTFKWWGAERSGAVAMTIVFHRPAQAVTVPLLTTGLPNAFDRLQVTVHPNGYIILEIFHFDYGGPRTELIPVAWDRPYHLEALLGSLYPEANDPAFATWQQPTVSRGKTAGWVQWEGRTVIKRDMAFFQGTPRYQTRGSAGVGELSPAAGAAVQIRTYLTGQPIPPTLLAGEKPSPAAYRLTVVLNRHSTRGRLPLLCSGVTGDGDLLLLDPLPNGNFRLVVDQWGSEPLIGPEFTWRENVPTLLEILAGPALATDPGTASGLSSHDVSALSRRLIVWRGGEVIGNFRVARHLDSFDRLLLGKNEAGFTSAEADFEGTIASRPMGANGPAELAARALATPQVGEPRGNGD